MHVIHELGALLVRLRSKPHARGEQLRTVKRMAEADLSWHVETGPVRTPDREVADVADGKLLLCQDLDAAQADIDDHRAQRLSRSIEEDDGVFEHAKPRITTGVGFGLSLQSGFPDPISKPRGSCLPSVRIGGRGSILEVLLGPSI